MAMSEMDTWKDIQNFSSKFCQKLKKFIPLPLKIHHNKTLMLFYD